MQRNRDRVFLLFRRPHVAETLRKRLEDTLRVHVVSAAPMDDAVAHTGSARDILVVENAVLDEWGNALVRRRRTELRADCVVVVPDVPEEVDEAHVVSMLFDMLVVPGEAPRDPGPLEPAPTSTGKNRAVATLTSREVVVLRLVAQGYSNKEIANELGLSVRTVENRRSRMTRKLNARSAAEMIYAAIREGFIPP